MVDSIRLGLMPPLTGLVEMYGPDITWAARIACDEINERGGVLGLPLELIIEDDGSLPATAVPAAERLIDSHRCVAIIGNLLSNSRIAVTHQVAEPKKTPLLNFSFYEGSIASRYFFHFAALPNQQIDKMIPFMGERFGLKMFFAGNNYEWPRGSIDAGKRILSRLGGDIVGEEYLPFDVTAKEVDELLKKVASSGADVFVPYFAGKDQIALLTRFTEKGLKKHMAVVMGHYDEMMVSRLMPSVRKGFYSSNTYFMSLNTQENRRYLQRLVLQPGVNGIWPNGNGLMTNFGEGAYLCVHAFAQAVENAGSTDAEALVDALEKVSVTGPQGMVEMDAETHHASVNTYLSCCNEDGTFKIIEEFGRNVPRIPERYDWSAETSALHESPASSEVRKRLDSEVEEARQRLSSVKHILSITDMAILATDDQGVITEVNQSVCQMFGYEEQELVGMSVHLLLPPQFRQHHVESIERFVNSDVSKRRMQNGREISGYRKDGTFFPLEASIAKFLVGEKWFLVATMKDISERKQAEEALLRRATHDTLTGLPNRSLVRERLASMLQRSRRHGLSVAILFIDLDGFKLINDSHGHEIGDILLKNVAQRLLEQVRPGDTVGRLSGDEFVILCEQVEQPATMSMLAERINDTLRKPFRCNDLALFVSASIGIAIGSGNSHSAEDLLRSGDTAMYAVKQKGRDGWQFFNENLQDQAKLRLSIINGLRQAIERDELYYHFQPIVCAENARIIGAELLLRWQSAEGEVSPAVFIPVAEMTGAILPIGMWVFRQACLAEVDWRARWGLDAPYISVNVSARQLNEERLADDFEAVLKETGANPKQLLLEITETSLMADVESNLRILRKLTSLGLKIAVDDFGTGYSSLSQLTRLPVHVLKIDRVFIDGLSKSSEYRTVIRLVIGLGRELGLKLIAEGVENGIQQHEVYAYGCDYLQGYFFHKPLGENVFHEVFERQLQGNLSVSISTLHFFIYVSRSVEPTSENVLKSMLKKSREYNRSHGITGCLFYRDGYFMQMLEGKKDDLDILMQRINSDKRHSDIQVVIEGPAKERVFKEWGLMVHDLSGFADSPDFEQWRKQAITFKELAEDPYVCYNFIRAHRDYRFFS